MSKRNQLMKRTVSQRAIHMYVFAIHPLAASPVAAGSGSLILCLVRQSKPKLCSDTLLFFVA
jgi:hypothetical protein